MKEFDAKEGKAIVTKHIAKIFHTLEILMSHLNMKYYWHRLQVFFHGRDPHLEELSSSRLYDFLHVSAFGFRCAPCAVYAFRWLVFLSLY